jgi:hypothetical protein
VKALPPYRIMGRVIRIGEINSPEATAWPWPFDADRDSAWKARYHPEQLTPSDAMDLAGIADAYSTLITHPSRSLRERVHLLHRIWREQP